MGRFSNVLQKLWFYSYNIFDILYKLWFYCFDRIILYPMVRCLTPTIDMQFMNLGYWPNETTTNLDKKMIEVVNKYSTLSDSNRSLLKERLNISNIDSNRPHYYLYEKPLSMHPQYSSLNNLSILEVGCGHGNGIKWIRRSHPEISSIKGLDICAKPNQYIVQGDAHDLPFSNNLFDISQFYSNLLKYDSNNNYYLVLNVESSHLYSDCSIFFKECSRVLKQGGYLCWIDLRYNIQMSDVYRQAEKAELRREYCYDVTDNVIQGIQRTSARYDEILKKLPLLMRILSSSFRSTYCAPGTKSYGRLLKREKSYYAVLWKNMKMCQTTKKNNA
uniref:Methyltransf_11 domain-containing protein n=1 Tax=Heterorhabditis bacteriophora TaxID=37862 RepID=A0A1I7WMX3_HETBA